MAWPPLDEDHNDLARFQAYLIAAVNQTREDPQLPLARLRAQGRPNELRAADLRFTTMEVADFLNRMRWVSQRNGAGGRPPPGTPA